MEIVATTINMLNGHDVNGDGFIMAGTPEMKVLGGLGPTVGHGGRATREGYLRVPFPADRRPRRA